MFYNSVIVDNSQIVQLLKQSIYSSKIIALDTEFIRKNTYYPQLSILQICVSDDKAYILDYIKYPDIVLDILKTIYKTDKIKVFHSAKNDLEIFYYLMGKLPTNIFDTQIAFMGISNISSISYANLIYKLLNIKLEKSETLSSWNLRPITKKQLEYASLDVIMLYKAYFVLFDQLKKQNRLLFIENKLKDLTNSKNYSFDINKNVERFILQYNINKNIPLLASLINWRENLAKQCNLTKKSILTDSLIKDIVKYPKKINYLTGKNKYLDTNSIIEIKKQALQKFNYLDNSLDIHCSNKHKLLSICIKLLDFTSHKENLNKDLICTKKELNDFLIWYNTVNNKQNLNYPQNLEIFFKTWRYKIFTEKLLLFLNGKMYITIENNDISFKDNF